MKIATECFVLPRLGKGAFTRRYAEIPTILVISEQPDPVLLPDEGDKVELAISFFMKMSATARDGGDKL